MKSILRLSILIGCALTVFACCFLRPGPLQRTRPLTVVLHSSVPSPWTAPITFAAATWNGVYPLFAYGGYSSFATGSKVHDGINSVYFSSALSKPTALAETILSISSPPCGIPDTDMGISPNWPWAVTTTPFSWQYDAESTMLHEFGHYGYLDHVVCPRSSVMYSFQRAGEMKRSLRACDSLGMSLTNRVPECYILTGICFPSFSFLGAFDDTDDEDQGSISPFKAHQAELIQIWEGDSTLRSSSDAVGDFYSRMLDDYRNGGGLAYNEYFTSARYQEIDSKIISRIYASASTGLRTQLNGVRSTLQGKVGRRLSAIFTSDTQQYEPAGGYREGSGGPPPV